MAPRRIYLPRDAPDWVSLVEEHGLQSQALGQLSHPQGKRFSGSDLPDRAFLQLRAVWPGITDYKFAEETLQSASFCSRQDIEAAKWLLDPSSPRRGLAIVHRFFDSIDREDRALKNPPRTPEGNTKARRWLGVQWHAMSPVIRNVNELAPKEADTHPRSSPKVSLGDSELPSYGFVRPLDFGRLPPERTPSPDSSTEASEEEEGLGYIASQLARATLDTPSKVPIDIRTKASAKPAPERAPKESSTDPTSDAAGPGAGTGPGASSTASADPPQNRKQPPGRTPYEVQTSSFFDKFISGFIGQAFPFPCGLFLKLEERRYKFGGTGTAPQGQGQATSSTLFNACPDGVFFRRDGGSETVFALVELKPFRRSVQERLIGMEETAEMAAYLCEDGAQRRLHRFVNRQDPNLFHQLIVSFDRDEFWFVVADYRQGYLDYIWDPASPTLPVGASLGSGDIITFKRIGPFGLHNADMMRIFAHLFLAILLAQVKLPFGGDEIYKDIMTEEVE